MKQAAEKPTGGRKAKELAVEFPLMLLMTASVVYPFVTALEFKLGIPAVLLISFLCLAFWSVSLYNWKTALCTLGLLVAGTVVLLVIFSSKDGAQKFADAKESVNAFFYWAGMYLKGYRATNLVYATRLVAGFALVLSLAVFLFTVKQFDMITVLLTGLACYVTLVVIGHVINLPALFGYILAASLYIALGNYKRNLKHMPKERAPGLPSYMASVLPLAAVVLVATVFISSSLKIDPDWMKDIREKLLKKVNPSSFQIPQNMVRQTITGDELGGDVSLSDDIVMEVRSPVSDVHLRALSKDFYTGHSWARTDTDREDYSAKLLEDTIETSSLFTGDASTFDTLFPSTELSIRYKEFATGVLYAPLKLQSLNVSEKVDLIGGDMLMLARGNGYDISYTLQYYQPQYGEDWFKEFARTAEGYPTARRETYEELDSFIRQQYTQLPDSVPQRVRELARQLTDGKSNVFDKASAVESYLKRNFAYTFTPGGCDPNRDFVDQFLFEGKKGYCTYFATAMVVLLRSVGIPARYAEGYVLPSANKNGLYEVTKKQGHAWAEVYFSGLGWLTFEPTASFSGSGSSNTQTQVTPKPTVRPRPTFRPEEDTSAKPVKNGPKIQWDSIIGLLTIVFITLLALFLVGVPNRARILMHRMDPREASIRLFAQHLQLLEAQGAGPENGEDLALYAKKIDGLYALERPGFGSAVEIFHLARFSEHAITFKQRHHMYLVRTELLKASRKKLGFFKYRYFKFIWGA